MAKACTQAKSSFRWKPETDQNKSLLTPSRFVTVRCQLVGPLERPMVFCWSNCRGHGVSLLWWRSGGVEHPHDTPPYPFMLSPTSAHSSVWCGGFAPIVSIKPPIVAPRPHTRDASSLDLALAAVRRGHFFGAAGFEI